MSELYIGARGWRFPHWAGGFYPEDMPKEWWFSYYSNEFDSVLVPMDYLATATVDTIEAWVDACPDEFRFFVEVFADAAWPQLQPLLQAFDRQLGGLLVKSSGAHDDESHLLNLINELRCFAQVCIEPSLTQPFSVQDRLNIERLCEGIHWHVESEDVESIGAEFLIGCFESTLTLNPLAMRNLIEKCRLSINQNLAPGLFFSGMQPKIENIRSAGVIYQLLE